jgi:hypothetical protein
MGCRRRFWVGRWCTGGYKARQAASSMLHFQQNNYVGGPCDLAKPWDDTMKRLIRAYPQHFVSWVLKGAIFKDALSIELKNWTRETDFLLDVIQNEQQMLMHMPTGYATSEPRGGESPENLAKTAEKWLPERKLSLCRCWKEWKQGVSYGTVILRWEKEGCYRIPFTEQAPQTYPLLGTML